ncbi:MAG TPA: hypothetical protein VFZ98_05515 [Vicinamibacterales bacterium]
MRRPGADYGRLAATSLVVSGLFWIGCGGSSGGSPAPPTAPTPPPGGAITGTVVDSLTTSPIPGVDVNMQGVGDVTSGADGSFRISTTTVETAHLTTLSSASTVQRTTHLNAPGPAATLSLIGSSFDLPSYDQMFRGDGGVLHRWTQAPSIVVQTRVLQYTNLTDVDYTALSASMSDAEVSTLVGDLTWTLPQLTGNSFAALANQTQETAAAGASVHVSRTGLIVVARYEGLTVATGYWGYTRWAWNGDGQVQAAIMMIDRAFDTSNSVFRRSLHAHEFGHALGYNHVTLRTSVMNADARTEPTPFDRDGATIAFERPPLNKTPDVDPDPFTINAARSSVLVWRGDR